MERKKLSLKSILIIIVILIFLSILLLWLIARLNGLFFKPWLTTFTTFCKWFALITMIIIMPIYCTIKTSKSCLGCCTGVFLVAVATFYIFILLIPSNAFSNRSYQITKNREQLIVVESKVGWHDNKNLEYYKPVNFFFMKYVGENLIE